MKLILLSSVILYCSSASVWLEKRIVNGVAMPKKLSWLLSIRDVNNKHFCAASMISEDLAATALHCFNNLDLQVVKERFSVSGGVLNLNRTTMEEGGFDVKILDIRKHPEFNQDTFENDIAIIKVAPMPSFEQAYAAHGIVQRDTTDGGMINRDGEKLAGLRTFGEGFKAIFKEVTMADNVDTANPINSDLWVAGWGRTKAQGTPSHVLLRAAVNIAKEKECMYDLRVRFPMDKVACAVGDDRIADTCQGDSGGPLYRENNGTQILVGIVSFGVGCGTERESVQGVDRMVPGAYTSITYYKDFIDQAIREMSSKPPAALPATQPPPIVVTPVSVKASPPSQSPAAMIASPPSQPHIKTTPPTAQPPVAAPAVASAASPPAAVAKVAAPAPVVAAVVPVALAKPAAPAPPAVVPSA